ncbi:MAG: protein kinase [Planctomycetales bacterium]|nr:protein kinase [Planctomycetales bacterium]
MIPPRLTSVANGSQSDAAKAQLDGLEETLDSDRRISVTDAEQLSSSMGGSSRNELDGTKSNDKTLTQDVIPRQFGRYEVRKVLGQGAFGAVYLGFDRQLERHVAIKAPRLDLRSENVEREFLIEARQLAKLKHPGIVAVHDVGVDAGRCYIVSEYLEGDTLQNWMASHRPSWQQSTRIIAALADALAHAHANRTVHRDLKPSNVIMVDNARPVIVDFGLALSDAKSRGTEKGMLSGTPAYMAPEQACGRGHRIDGRTDIYALGVILYRLLTRQLPFQSHDVPELLRQVQEDEPQPPRQLARDIPPALETICLKAMAKKFQHRYSTADDLAHALRMLVAPEAAETATLDFNPQPDSAFTPSATVETTAALESDEVPHSTGSGSTLVASRSGEGSTVRRVREAERRRVTVVQCGCDVFESEEILEALGEDEQADLLAEFQAICRAVVERHCGHIVQATDRGSLACFGYPAALEDATLRAVRAGLDVVASVDVLANKLQARKGIRLAATVAVHSDNAVVEDKGEGDTFSLTGQVRTVVSQVELATDMNTVVLTDATHRLVKGYFECENLGPQRLRGIGQISLYRVQCERTHDRIQAAEVGGELTPLIGRDREVGLLEERWEQASEGMGQVVLLIGEAGLGKSRLVHVLKEHVRARSDAAFDPVIEWRTVEHHQSSSLHSVIECFERMLGFEREIGPEQRLDKLVDHLAALNLDSDESIAILASLLSIPIGNRCPELLLSPQESKDRTFALLLNWLRESATRQPILFVVEDLHWIDPSTLEFLEILVNEGLNDRILTLLTFRPEFETPWKSKAHQTSVALNRLTKRQVGEMIVARSGLTNIPKAIVEQLVDRTDGVPLFIEEFTTMVVQSGRTRAGESGAELSGSFSLAEIPATLQDLLMARLDRMAGNVDLVQLAAALGREFAFDLLSAVSEMDSTTLTGELAMLVTSELLIQRGRPPLTHYYFKHALIQDAAYQSLVKKKRQQVHERIARTLEARFVDICKKQPEVLARHFTEAGILDKAVHYWEEAGERSLSRSAHHEAIQQLSQGLALLRSLPESRERDAREVQMHVRLGVPLQSTKGYSAPEVEENYVHAHELCEQMGLDEEAFPVLYGLFRYFMLQAKYPKATELGQQLVELAERSQDPSGLVAAHRAISGPLVYRGQHTLAVPHLEKVISIQPTEALRKDFYRYDVVDPWITSLCYLAWAKWLLGFPDQAKRYSQEAVATAERLKHPFSIALALSFSQWLHQFSQDVVATQEAVDRALKIAEDQGFAFWLGWGRVLRGWTEAQQGRAAHAIEEIREGIAAWRRQGSELGCHYYFVLLAESCLKAGRVDEAATALDDAQAFSDTTGERYWASEIYRVRGELLLKAGERDLGAVAIWFNKAIELARAQDAKSLELRAAICLARLLQSNGKTNEARAALAPIFNWFTEGFDTHDLVQAKRVLDELSST